MNGSDVIFINFFLQCSKCKLLMCFVCGGFQAYRILGYECEYKGLDDKGRPNLKFTDDLKQKVSHSQLSVRYAFFRQCEKTIMECSLSTMSFYGNKLAS
jgi:hypothetical protein